MTTAGGLEPGGNIRLDAEGLGMVTLRSDSSSGAEVSAQDAAANSTSAQVTFRPPWLFFAMAVIGGLGGAFLRRKGRQRWSKALPIGVVTAVAAAGLYAVGYAPKLMELAGARTLAASGEVLVAGIGFLAALVGVSWFVPGAGSGAKRAAKA